MVVKSGADTARKLRGTSRDDIIEVSRAIIEDEGVEQLTIRRIAETIDRKQPAVYQQFSGKDAILEAVVVYGFAQLAERLERAASGGTGSLAAIAGAYVRFGLERPRLYSLMFVGPPAITFAAGTATPMAARNAFTIIAGAVSAAGVSPTQADTVTEAVWASLHGLVTLSATKRLRPGRALQQTRLELIVAAIVTMSSQQRHLPPIVTARAKRRL